MNISHPYNAIIRLKELIILIELSRSTIYDKQNPKSKRYDPNFPKRIKLGARAVGWRRADVNSWLDSMINKSISGDDHG